MPNILDDLRKAVRARKAIVVVGTGVSIGATQSDPKAPLASWTGLLRSGIEWCEHVVNNLPDGWVGRQYAALDKGDAIELIGVAQEIESRLSSPGGTQFRKWIKSTIGQLHVTHPKTIQAIQRLGVQIITTNYDGLLEEITKLRPITWRERHRIEALLHGDLQDILHLHGYWEEPESIVLGMQSYDRILADDHTQAAIHALLASKILLFIGYGRGFQDPNFRAMIKYVHKVHKDSEYVHFRLVSQEEEETIREEHKDHSLIHVVSYGDYDKLGPFLHNLKRTSAVKTPSPASGILTFQTSAHLPVAPRCFGRDKEIQKLTSALLVRTRPIPPISINGSPGIGKSTLALVALHHKDVAKRFGKERYFIRCDAVTNRTELAGAVARSVGVPIGQNLESRLLDYLYQHQAIVVLDNLETPWDKDPSGTEELLKRITAATRVALVITIRGEQTPFGIPWGEVIHVTPLSRDAARTAFISIAGEQFHDDTKLDPLMKAVEFVPLCIVLLAHRAQPDPDLNGLWHGWETKRTEILKLPGRNGRDSNMESSLELSIKGPRMDDLARRLLSMLGVLADGISRDCFCYIFRDAGDEAARKLRACGLAYDDQDRLRVLSPLRTFVEDKLPAKSDDLCAAASFYVNFLKNEQKALGRLNVAYDHIEVELNNILATLRWCSEAKDFALGREILTRLTRFLWNRGHWEIQTNILEQAIGDMPMPDHIRAKLCCNTAWVHSRRGNPETAMAWVNKAKRFLAGGAAYESGLLEHTLGQIAYRQDRFCMAEKHLNRALEVYADKDMEEVRIAEADVWDNLGDLYRDRGLWHLEKDGKTAARRYLEKALHWYARLRKFAEENHWLEKLATSTGDIGHVSLYLDSYNQACKHLDRGLKLATDIGRTHTIAYCKLGLGEFCAVWDAQYRTSAIHYLQEAQEAYRILGLADVIEQINKWLSALQDFKKTGMFVRPNWVRY